MNVNWVKNDHEHIKTPFPSHQAHLFFETFLKPFNTGGGMYCTMLKAQSDVCGGLGWVGCSWCSSVSEMLMLEDGWMPQGRSPALAPVDEALLGPPVTAHGPGCDTVTRGLDDD